MQYAANRDLRNENPTYWSEAQWKIFQYAPAVPSLLSMVGSSLIIYPIIAGKLLQKKPYHRLLFGLSCMDIIFSIRITTIYLFVLNINEKEPSAACTAYGFTSVFGGVGGPLYNLGLSVFFYFSICKNMKPHMFSKRIEPAIHIVAITFTLLVAILGVAFQFFNPSELGQNCLAESYPQNCGKENEPECIHGQGAKIFSWVFMSGPMIFVILPGITFTNVSIYVFVRKTMKNASRFMKPDFINKAPLPRAQRYADAANSTFSLPNFSASMKLSCDESNKNSDSKADIVTTIKSRLGKSKKTPASLALSATRTRNVAIHSFLYVFVFFITWVWRFFLIVFGSSGKTRQTDPTLFFVLETLEKTLNPMQGFFNYCIYIKSSYLKWRKAFAEKGRLWALKMATFSDEAVKDYKRTHVKQNQERNPQSK